MLTGRFRSRFRRRVPAHYYPGIRLLERARATIHRAPLRRCPRIHAAPHVVLRLATEPRSPRRSGLLHRYRRLGDPPRRARGAHHSRPIQREVLWVSAG